MPRLVVRFAHRPTESVRIYVLRLTEANGYSDPSAVRRVAGLPATYAAQPCDLSGLVAAVGGLTDLGTLERAASWQDADGLVRLGATRLAPALVAFSRPRVCVRCLDEGRATEAGWDVTGCGACPRHGTVLTDACTCGRPLGWSRPALARCRCGRRLEACHVDAPAAAVDVARTLTALANGQAGPHADLPLTTLDAFAHAVRFLGCADAAAAEWRSNLMTKPTVAGSLAAACRAAPALADWPHGWHDWVLAPGRFGEAAASGAERAILHRRLRVLLSRPGMEGMLDETRRAVASGPHGPLLRPSDFLYTDRAPATFVRGMDAARRLGVCSGTVATLIARGEIQGESLGAGRRRAHVLPVTGIDELVSARAASYDASEAARRLGITVRQIAALRRAGVLPVMRGIPGVRGAGRYGPATVAGLLDRIAVHVAPGLHPGDVSLRDVAERRWVRLPEVLSAVLRGELSVRAPVLPIGGIGDVHVAGQAVLRLRHPRTEECLDVREAASRLGVSIRMIPVLVRAGCLVAQEQGPGALARRSVTERSVAAFPRRYVLASEYAASWRTNTRTAIARLKERGAIAVVEPDAGRGISSVWRRTPSRGRIAPDTRRERPRRSASHRPFLASAPQVGARETNGPRRRAS